MQRVRQLVADHAGQPRLTPASAPCPPTAVTSEVGGVRGLDSTGRAGCQPVTAILSVAGCAVAAACQSCRLALGVAANLPCW
jgi:hypothetical protein